MCHVAKTIRRDLRKRGVSKNMYVSKTNNSFQLFKNYVVYLDLFTPEKVSTKITKFTIRCSASKYKLTFVFSKNQS